MIRFGPCACAIVLAAWMSGARGDGAEPARRPNVVILYADDMGVGDVGAGSSMP